MPRRLLQFTITLFLFLFSLAISTATASDILIKNARIVDGSGAPSFIGAVRVQDRHIVAVGELSPNTGERVFDAQGLVLAPGFIDTHSHHDSGWQSFRDMKAVLTQGITTIVRGADGFDGGDEAFGYLSQEAFSAAFEAAPAAVNIASYSPHGNLRSKVMGADFKRAATAEEITQMAALLQADLDHGALGLSTGLEYQPGIFSETAEIIALSRVASAAGGRYASHIRDEDDLFLDALGEVIRIGREANIPVHVSHIKLADKAFWGTTAAVIGRLNAARAEGIDISADIYPYLYWASTLSVLFPDKDYTDPEVAKFTFQRTTDPETLLLTSFAPNPELAGLNFAQLAARLETSPENALLTLAQQSDDYLQRTGRIGDGIIARGMEEQDVLAFMQWPFTNICSDGSHDGAHPRGWGSFPRFLKRYATPENGFTLEQAIARMTALAARNAGIRERGMIRPGYFADLVLFDPELIVDNATFESPHEPSSGIERVWVNGIVAFDSDGASGLYPGQLIHR